MVEFKSPTTFPVTSGLFDNTHFENIGPALWLYLWLVDKTTSDEELTVYAMAWFSTATPFRLLRLRPRSA